MDFIPQAEEDAPIVKVKNTSQRFTSGDGSLCAPPAERAEFFLHVACECTTNLNRMICRASLGKASPPSHFLAPLLISAPSPISPMAFVMFSPLPFLSKVCRRLASC